jgi:segregation and condensation protein B
VTTPAFLAQFGFETLRDLPDFEKLEDAGLLSKDRLLAGDFPIAADGSGSESPQLDPDGK